MRLVEHAADADDIRAAAEYARGIMDNLKAIAGGVQTAQERTAKVDQVDRWLRSLATKLGYKVEVE